jgi:hypothetical protein
MAKYTTTIKTLRELNFPLGLTAADYPIFDEAYRPTLNKKILDHYQFREIGFETPALFAWFLNVRLREIMPYYNALYATTILQYNPLYNFETIEESTKTTEGISESDGNSDTTSSNSNTSRGKNIGNDTPMTQLSLASLDADLYATTANLDETEADGSATSASTMAATNTIDNTDTYLRTVKGNNGNASYAKLIQEARDLIINLDMKIIDELRDLFMLIY